MRADRTGRDGGGGDNAKELDTVNQGVWPCCAAWVRNLMGLFQALVALASHHGQRFSAQDLRDAPGLLLGHTIDAAARVTTIRKVLFEDASNGTG